MLRQLSTPQSEYRQRARQPNADAPWASTQRLSALLRCLTRREGCPSSDLLPSRIRHDVVGGVVRASNIDDQTPVVAEGGEEIVCEVRPPNSTVTDFDRVIDQPAVKLRYGSHHQQSQKDCRYDELDPFLVVREPSMHMIKPIHGQPPSGYHAPPNPNTLSHPTVDGGPCTLFVPTPT